MFGGTSSNKRNFPIGESTDQRISDMLQLYKPIASVRDMKTSFMYINVIAGVTDIDPLRLIRPTSRNFPQLCRNFLWSSPVDPAFPVFLPGPAPVPDPYFRNLASSGKKWYAPIGTTQRFNIANLISELTDIRVPKDKIVIEINLAECQIESDPTNWQSIPDKVFYINYDRVTPANSTLEIENTWRRDLIYSELEPFPTPPAPITADSFVTQILPRVTQATKQYQPETLYVRIKELSNGQPYNWTVTNSGEYSVDKNHQVLLKYGDMAVDELTLEFGHLVFGGTDNDQVKLLQDNVNSGEAQKMDRIGQLQRNNGYTINNNLTPPEPSILAPGQTLTDWCDNITGDNNRVNSTNGIINKDQNYYYLDYNQEYYNTICVDNKYAFTATGAVSTANTLTEFNYIDQYRGVLNNGKTIIAPADRPPYTIGKILANGGTNPGLPFADASTSRFLEQGIPLKYSQQVRALSFRFAVKIISLF